MTTPHQPNNPMMPNNLMLLPPALAKALTDYAAMTRQDRMVLVTTSGDSTTIIPLPDGDAADVFMILNRALKIATAQASYSRPEEYREWKEEEEDGGEG